MEEKKLEKTLSLTKKGFPVLWVQTVRFTGPVLRYGQSGAICNKEGKLSKIIRSIYHYTKVKHLVRLTDDSAFVQSSYNINGNKVEIYELEKIDKENMKAIFNKVATFEDGKWDNVEYYHKYKETIHSTLQRAKKFYKLSDLD